MSPLIYKITSPSGRIYIGQTIDYKFRLNRYKNLLCKKQRRLYNSFKKYGFEKHVFEILERCSINELNDRERYYQDLYNVTSKMGLNIRLVKSNERNGTMPESVKRKISIKNTGILNGMYGKKITECTKNLQRIGLSGEKNYLSKWILNLETGIFYPCLREAGNSINMDKRVLWSNIKKNKTNRTSFIFA